MDVPTNCFYPTVDVKLQISKKMFVYVSQISNNGVYSLKDDVYGKIKILFCSVVPCGAKTGIQESPPSVSRLP